MSKEAIAVIVAGAAMTFPSLISGNIINIFSPFTEQIIIAVLYAAVAVILAICGWVLHSSIEVKAVKWVFVALVVIYIGIASFAVFRAYFPATTEVTFERDIYGHEVVN